MRAFTTKGGQIFEVWENRKEALHDVADIIDGIRYAIEIGQRTDDLLWVQYKDGSHYCISEEGEEGRFKKINIEAIIDQNDCTTMIWGKVDIYNIDDIDEKYSEGNDDESKFWNVT
ncbi:hypothetical protein DWX94_04280 [Coprococcus eutactus]|jgi:hypothetical protein|uniref:Uncharacterized protein n=1 Tax=Coprococcus eutactus TaxID=33043 RepID=A0A3R5ZPS2_9FIRM|nr:hypothetical protein DWX94_04280 [Coprococcus eutactus]